jgi:hypothetical protein
MWGAMMESCTPADLNVSATPLRAIRHAMFLYLQYVYTYTYLHRFSCFRLSHVVTVCCLPVASLLPPWWYLCVWRPQWMLPIHSSTPWLTQVPLTLTQDGHIGQPCGIGQRCVLENSWGQCTVSARIIERSQEYKSTLKYRTFVLLRIPIPRGFGSVL